MGDRCPDEHDDSTENSSDKNFHKQRVNKTGEILEGKIKKQDVQNRQKSAPGFSDIDEHTEQGV